MRVAIKVRCLKAPLRGRRTAGSKSKQKYRGEKEEEMFFGIQFFENPISRFMSAYCNRFVINESCSFPISYRLIFNKFVSVRLKLRSGIHLTCFLFNIAQFVFCSTLPNNKSIFLMFSCVLFKVFVG